MATPAELATDLGLSPGSLSGLSELPTADFDRLDALVRRCVAEEDDLVSRSLEAALDAVPRPLRRRARTLLLEES